MKMFFYVLVLIGLSTAQTYKVTNTKSDTIGIGVFMSDISEFLDKPLNWCSITPKGDISADTNYYSDSVTVKLALEVICNESSKYDAFTKFIKKHQVFVDTHEKLVDKAISNKYPDYELYWSDLTHGVGVEINYDTVAYIRGTTDYGFSLHNDKKAMFVSMKVGKYTTNPLYVAFNGNTISTKKCQTTNDVQNFTVNIPLKYVKSIDELEFSLTRIWHTTKDQKVILSNIWKM